MRSCSHGTRRTWQAQPSRASLVVAPESKPCYHSTVTPPLSFVGGLGDAADAFVEARSRLSSEWLAVCREHIEYITATARTEVALQTALNDYDDGDLYDYHCGLRCCVEDVVRQLLQETIPGNESALRSLFHALIESIFNEDEESSWEGFLAQVMGRINPRFRDEGGRSRRRGG